MYGISITVYGISPKCLVQLMVFSWYFYHIFQASTLSLKPQADHSVDLANEIENLVKLKMVRHNGCYGDYKGCYGDCMHDISLVFVFL